MSNSELNKSIVINETASLLQQSSENNNDKNLELSRSLIYISHSFAKGSDVAWQFCIVLFLAAFTNYENLILVSTYFLFSGLAVCLTGGYVGKFIDRNARLFTARVFIWVQNMSVLAATFFCYLLLLINDEHDEEGADMILQFGKYGKLKGVPTSHYGIALLVGVHFFGAVANVLDQGITVAIEKDWIVVMSKVAGRRCANNNSQNQQQQQNEVDFNDVYVEQQHLIKDWLSETNITMTQIGLSCNSLAPAAAGFLLTIYGDNLKGAALFVGALNISCLIVEWFCTAFVFRLIPDLAIKLDTSSPPEPHHLTNQVADDLVTHHNIKMNGKSIITQTSKYNCCLQNITPPGWKIYMKQSTAWSGIALALLYFNILTFGAIMTAYLVWRGMSLDSIGVWRGVSSVIGLLGTFAFRISISKLTLKQTGMWSISFQFICLSISYASLFVHNYTLSLIMLIAGVCASRIGLWVFDVTMKQFFQECVEEEVRGVVGGLQHSLQAFFGLITFGLGIMFPDPNDFYILVGSGYLSVGIALLLYWIGFYRSKDISV